MPRFQFGEGSFQTDTRELRLPNGEVTELKPKNAEVLELLIGQRETVVSRESLFQKVWPDVIVSEQALNKVINELRTALKDKPRDSIYIKTYTKKGYRWIYPNTQDATISSPATPGADPLPVPPVLSPSSTTTLDSGYSEPTEATDPHASRSLIVPTLAMAALICLITLGLLNREPPTQDLIEKLDLALLPILNETDNPENDWIELGLREQVLQTMQQDGNFETISLKTLKKGLKLVELEQGAAPSQAQIDHLQSLFPFSHLVQTRITNHETGYLLTFDIFTEQGRETREIKAESLPKCGNLMAYNLMSLRNPDVISLMPDSPPSLDDFVNETYAKGIEFFENRELNKAINHFEVCLDNEDMIWAKLHLARSFRLKGDNQRAETLLADVYESAQLHKNPILEAQALRYLGLIALHQGQWQKALSFSKRSRNIYDSLGNVQGGILTTNQIATILARTQQLDVAESMLMENWNTVSTRDNKYLFAGTGIKLATVMSMQGKIDEAEDMYFEVLKEFRLLKDRRNESSVLENLGNIHYLRKSHERAAAYYNQALDISRELGNRRAQAGNLHNLGVVATAVASFDEAETLHHQALALSREAGDRYLENQVIYNLGGNALRAAKLTQADQQLRKAVEMALELDNTNIYVDAVCHLVLVHVRQADLKTALEWLDQIETKAQDMPIFHTTSALVAYQRGLWEQAVDFQIQARDLAQKTWTPQDERRLQVFQNAVARKKQLPLVSPGHIPSF